MALSIVALASCGPSNGSITLDSDNVPEGSRWVAAVLVLDDGSYLSSGLIPPVAGEPMVFELPADAVRRSTQVVFKGYAEHQISSLFCPNDDVLSTSPLYAFDRATLNAAEVPLLPTDRWNLRGAIGDGGAVTIVSDPSAAPREDELIYLGAEWMPTCPTVVRTTDSYEAYCRPDLRCRGKSAGEISADACSVVVFTPRQLVGNLMSDCEHVELESATVALEFPPSGSATDQSELAIAGTTAGDVPIVDLRVNNATAGVELCHLRFFARVPVEVGNTDVQATATDAFGHTATAPLGTFLRGSFPARPGDIEVRGDRVLVADELGLHELASSGLRRVADGSYAGVAVSEDGAIAFATHRELGVVELDLREKDAAPRAIAATTRSPSDLTLEGSGRTLLVSNGDPLGLVRVELPNGETTAVSNLSVGTGPMFSVQGGLALGAEPNRAFVADGRAILEVDTVSGDRSLFTDCPELAFEHASDLAIDAQNKTALVTDRAGGALISIDLQSRACTLVSGPARGDGPRLSSPNGVAFDAARGRALVSDDAAGTIYAIELDSGDRSEAIDFHVGAGAALASSSFAAYDAQRSRILATDETNGAIVAFDLATGDRSVISGALRGSGPELRRPAGIAVDSNGPRAIVAVSERVLAIDLESGAREELSGPDRGAGPALERPQNMAIDAGERRAFALDGGRLIEVSLNNGDRRTIDPATTLASIAFDETSKRILAIDANGPTLVSIDPSTGAREELAVLPANAKGSIHIDTANRRAILAAAGDLLAIDLVSGMTASISSDCAPGPKLASAAAVVIPADDHSPLYVLDTTRRALFAVDARTGARAIVSR